MFYIGMEDVVANALIQIMRLSQDDEKRTFLTYESIEKYGMQVVRYLKKSGDRAVLIFSRERTNTLLENYADFFEEVADENGKLGIRLRTDKSELDLIQRFRGYLPIRVLRAFVSVKVAA